MFSRILSILYLCIFIIVPSFLNSQNLYINEFLASNNNTIDDEDGNSSDWIEIYNNENISVNLGGYSITDKDNQPFKWIFPDVEMPPKSFLVVWASDKDRYDVNPLHTNFKLSADGEYIGLYAPNGSVIDSIYFSTQQEGISQGRWPDGSPDFYQFNNPTPGLPNQKKVHLTASHPGGVYTSAIYLELITNNSIGSIYYTTDGTIPSAASELYTGPIYLNSNAAIRAVQIFNNKTLAELDPETYLINDIPRLAILSLITDPDHLWHHSTGIYVNPDGRGDDWERPVHVAFYEENSKEFSIHGGVRIHGDLSRDSPKKNMRLYFRSEYGKNKLEYPIFPDMELDEFKRLILYAPSRDQCSYNEPNNYYTYIIDMMSHALWQELGYTPSTGRPLSVYLNSEYWGMYWLRERIDRYFVEEHFDIVDMDLHQDDWREYKVDVKEGTVDFWTETLNFFRYSDMKIEENFKLAKEKYVNLNNITDYWLLNIYIANYDWPQKNVDRYRNRINDTRWNWQVWDTDAAWRWYNKNTLQFAVRDTVGVDDSGRFYDENFLWSTAIISSLLKNEQYRYFFINRLADLLNTTFLPENVRTHFEHFQAIVNPEINRELYRWAGSNLVSMPSWSNNLAMVDGFISRRPRYIKEDILETFHLMGFYDLELITSESKGTIQVNTIQINTFPWHGNYLKDIPVKLTAIPNPGYRFLKWQGASSSSNAELEIQTLNNNIQLEAIFVDQIKMTELAVDSVNHHQAIIHWKTDHETKATFSIGSDSLALSALDTLNTFSTHHTIQIDTLKPETTYYYQIKSWDALGDTTQSGKMDFTTLSAPAVPALIDSLNIYHLSIDSVKITCKTDQPTMAQLKYGKTLNYKKTLTDSLFNEDHNFLLTSLSDSTRYHFMLECTNMQQLTTHLQDTSFVTLRDTLAPELLLFHVTAIADTSALVYWKSNESAQTSIYWGTDTLNVQKHQNSTRTDSSSFHLHPLLADTIYYIQIELRDHRNNKTTSPWQFIQTLKTPPEPPRILTHSLAITRYDSAFISITTDQKTRIHIIFGSDTLNSQSLHDSTFAKDHKLLLTPLSDSTTYYYSVHSESEHGLTGTPLNHVFITPKDRIPPVFTSVAADSMTDSSAVIIWQTNEQTAFAMFLGLSQNALYLWQSDTSLSKSHTLQINPLIGDTIYYYQIHAFDHRQNESMSPVKKFRTLRSNQSAVQDGSHSNPDAFTLSPNYPNPFNQSTRWQITIPQNGHLTATIYNIFGREVIKLVDHSVTTGIQNITWNGLNHSSEDVSSAIYLIKVKYKPQQGAAKMISKRLILSR